MALWAPWVQVMKWHFSIFFFRANFVCVLKKKKSRAEQLESCTPGCCKVGEKVQEGLFTYVDYKISQLPNVFI